MILLLGGLALAAPAHAMDCFAEGTAAYRAQRYTAARTAFQAMQRRDECARDPLLRLNIARSAEAEVGAGGDPQLACLAVREYTLFLKSRPAAELKAVAEKGRGAMADLCAAAPLPEVDRTGAWIWTGGAAAAVVGGLVFNVTARGHLDDATAAVARQRAATDAATFTAAGQAADEAYDSAELHASTSYALLGLGAVLGGLAVWAWMDPEGPVGFAVGPGGLTGVVRW
ncbi:MAG: hypothetical protein H6702_19195 [Myxococcales bacterium]|nr:hypothetical protein [Myxococcales bacterium]